MTKSFDSLNMISLLLVLYFLFVLGFLFVEQYTTAF